MSARREQLLAWDVPVAASGWLPDVADDALYGLREPLEGDWTPVYGYLALVRAIGPEAAAAAISAPGPGGPWFIWPPDRASFWAKVEAKPPELVAWQYLTPAIVGVGWRLPEGESVAYDRGLVIDLLIAAYSDSRNLSPTKRVSDAEKYFKSNLLEANFGKANPIYIWRLPE